MSLFDELFKQSEDLSVEQIVNELMNDKNLILKTEIPNPDALLKLMDIERWLRSSNCPKSATVVRHHIDDFVLVMVSYDRKRVLEIIDALAKINEAKKISMTDKMFGSPKA